MSAPTFHLRPRELLGKMPAGPSKATAHVQDGPRIGRGTREAQHLVDKVVLGLLEILFGVTRSALCLAVNAQVYVLAPVVLQDSFLRPRIVSGGRRGRRGSGNEWPLCAVPQRDGLHHPLGPRLHS